MFSNAVIEVIEGKLTSIGFETIVAEHDIIVANSEDSKFNVVIRPTLNSKVFELSKYNPKSDDYEVISNGLFNTIGLMAVKIKKAIKESNNGN